MRWEYDPECSVGTI